MIKYNSSEIIECYLGNNMLDSIYKGSNLIWSAGPPDYSTMPLTIESLENDNTITIKSNGFTDDIDMIINVPQWGDNPWWISQNTTTNIYTLNRGEKIQIKSGWPTACSSTNYLTIGSSGTFKVYGNIMSVFGENNGSYIPILPSNYQFNRLFYNSKVVDASNLILPATTLADYCYYNMFRDCTSLITAPELPATTLINNCYYCMFYGCTSLTTAPELPATTLASNCYRQMFRGCTSLTIAPELPATTLVSNCYYYMFYGCTSLNYIKALFTTTPSTTYTDNWVNKVATNGTFIKSDSATWTTTGTSAAPATWGIYKENAEPFIIVSKSNSNTISIENTLGSSFYLFYDGNSKLISSSGTTTITTMSNNDIIRITANTSSITRSSSNYITIKATGDFIVQGNVMALLYSTNINSYTSVGSYQFYNLFKDNTYLKDASGLILPATTINSDAYDSMFRGCTSLVTSPRKLPAKLSTSYMYQYNHMFDGCTSLVKAPKLPSTTLSVGCYNYMFNGCTSLIKAPDLLATTLKNGCYQAMFRDCTSLSYIKAMFTTTPSDSYNQYWVYNVASTGTFVKNTSATWNVTGNHGVPSGWTVQTASS